MSFAILENNNQTLLLKTVRDVLGRSISTSFIYQPGGAGNGPVVFSSWQSLITALNSARVAGGGNVGGPFTIVIDDSITSPATIPAGTYDMTNVALSGLPVGAFASVANVSEGVIFTRLRRVISSLELAFTGATAPIADMQSSDVFFIQDNSTIRADGTGPMVDISGGASAFFIVNSNAFINQGSAPAIHARDSSAAFIIVGNDCIVSQNSLSCTADSSIICSAQDPSVAISTDHSGILGFSQFAYTGVTRWRANAKRTTPVTTVNPGYMYKFDTTSAAIAQTMPSAATFFPGDSVIFKKVAGVNSLTITPFSGDTIDESSAPVVISSPTGVATFVRGDLPGLDWSLIHLTGII